MGNGSKDVGGLVGVVGINLQFVYCWKRSLIGIMERPSTKQFGQKNIAC